jgi:hypothetical protein
MEEFEENMLATCHNYKCIITKGEDKKLNRKYNQNMPEGWINDWENWDARYKKVGIRFDIFPGNK